MGQVLSFEEIGVDNCPKSIILDTSFLLNLTTNTTDYPQAKYISDCVDFGKTLDYFKCKIFIPDVVVSEFCHEIYRAILEDKARKLKVRWRDLYERKPHLISEGHPKIKKTINILEEFFLKGTKKIQETGSNIRSKALKIMRKHHICPTDAYISSIAILNEIENIATLDVRCFRRIAEKERINIFSPKKLIKP